MKELTLTDLFKYIETNNLNKDDPNWLVCPIICHVNNPKIKLSNSRLYNYYINRESNYSRLLFIGNSKIDRFDIELCVQVDKQGNMKVYFANWTESSKNLNPEFCTEDNLEVEFEKLEFSKWKFMGFENT